MRDEDLQILLQGYFRDHGHSVQVGQPVRLTGGYDTDTFKITMSEGNASIDRVLRRYPLDQPDEKPIYEGLVHNELNDQGFPVPRVIEVCTDKSVVGGAFILMEFAEGKPLLYAPDHVQSTILGSTHALLHSLDSADLRNALGGIDDERFLFQWRVSKLESACDRHPPSSVGC